MALIKAKHLFLLLFLSTGLLSCQDRHSSYQIISGEVFGTYYRFQIDSKIDFSTQIDSIFQAVDHAANSYNSVSEISRFNQDGEWLNPSPTFLEMLDRASYYHRLTHGYFEPSLYPLINNWGFGFKNREKMDSLKVSSLLKKVSFSKWIAFDSTKVRALDKGVQIDLSALGEGYTLDAIAGILNANMVSNYMIEIGGEMNCKGVNAKGKTWTVGIENPDTSMEGTTASLMAKVVLKNEALSTSGNYRKFYTDSLGNKFPHIIDPKTGFPVHHRLLSVSIIAKSSILADAVATGCMAMGTEKAIELIVSDKRLEGFLIYNKDGRINTWHSENFFTN